MGLMLGMGAGSCLQTQTEDNIGAGWKVLWCGLTW